MELVVVAVLLAVTAAAAAPQGGRVLPENDVDQEPGKIGSIAPQPADVVAEDAPVHEDDRGTTNRDLLELFGYPGGGFAAVWRDGRDGNLGLYFTRLDAQGRPRDPERALYAVPRSSRQFDPAIALNSSGAGAYVWRDAAAAGIAAFYARIIRADGRVEEAQLSMGATPRVAAGRAKGRPPAQAAIAVLPDGAAVCVWLEEGRVQSQTVKPGAVAPPSIAALNRAEREAVARPLIAASPSGGWIAVWATEQGIDFHERGPRGSEDRGGAGDGVPLEIAWDPASGGYWMLVEQGDQRSLRRIETARGVSLHEERPAGADRIVVDLAPTNTGLYALLVERAADAQQTDRAGRNARAARDGTTALRARRAPLVAEVIFVPAQGQAARPPIAVESEGDAFSPRIAAAGDVALLAWAERLGGDTRVRCRVISVAGAQALGEVETVTRDQASANQSQATVSALGGDRAVVAWVDSRDGAPRTYARVLDSRGGFATGEIALPAPFGDVKEPPPAQAQHPTVALDARGRFLVAWFESMRSETADRETWGIRAQLFGGDGAPLAAAVVLERELDQFGGCDVVALPDDRGFALVRKHDTGAIVVQRIDARGATVGDPVRVSSDGEVGGGAIALLSPRKPTEEPRLIVVWDAKLAKNSGRLRARFVDLDLKPDGDELGFDTMWRGFDWGATVTAAGRGGFALAWVGGEDRSRDVYARVFDDQGRPASRPFAVSPRLNEQDFPSLATLADGSIAVAWEDDIAYHDFIYLRRIAPDFKSIGPTVTLCQRPVEYHPMHVAPRIAPLDTGLVAIWSDCRRSKGIDVYRRILGPRFDDPKALREQSGGSR